jgi:hypothetical protein
MKDQKTRPSRRSFLIGTGTAGVAGAAAIVGKGALKGEAQPAAKPDSDGRGGGYHVTDHVRSYYRTTLV